MTSKAERADYKAKHLMTKVTLTVMFPNELEWDDGLVLLGSFLQAAARLAPDSTRVDKVEDQMMVGQQGDGSAMPVAVRFSVPDSEDLRLAVAAVDMADADTPSGTSV